MVQSTKINKMKTPDKTPSMDDVLNYAKGTHDEDNDAALWYREDKVKSAMTEWSEIQNKQLLERIGELENELEDTKLGVDYWKGKFNELINI